MCVCSLRHPAYNAHASYCHLWPVRLYKWFSHYFTKARFSGGEMIEHQLCVQIFSTTPSETFLILSRTDRDINLTCKFTTELVFYKCILLELNRRDLQQWVFWKKFSLVPQSDTRTRCFSVPIFWFIIPVVFYANEGGWVRQNTTVVGSYLLV